MAEIFKTSITCSNDKNYKPYLRLRIATRDGVYMLRSMYPVALNCFKRGYAGQVLVFSDYHTQGTTLKNVFGGNIARGIGYDSNLAQWICERNVLFNLQRKTNEL